MYSIQVKKKVDAAEARGSSKRDKSPRGTHVVGNGHDEVINLQVPISRVWAVVSNLFQALSEARDDLLSLTSSQSFRGLRNLALPSSKSREHVGKSGSPPFQLPRSFSAPPESLRSIHASKTTTTLAASGVESTAAVAAHKANTNAPLPAATAGAEYCAPVAFGMNLDFERVQRGRSKSPAANSTLEHHYQHHQQHQQSPVRSQPTSTTTATTTISANMTSVALAAAAAAASNKAGTSSGSGVGAAACIFSDTYGYSCHQGKRICRAARYADLLRAEANELRERRLAEETMVTSRVGKPSWF